MRPLTANAEHADGGLVQLNKHAIVDLAKSEKLEHLSDLGRDLVDTTDPHDESQLGLPGHMKVAFLLGLPLQPAKKVTTLGTTC